MIGPGRAVRAGESAIGYGSARPVDLSELLDLRVEVDVGHRLRLVVHVRIGGDVQEVLRPKSTFHCQLATGPRQAPLSLALALLNGPGRSAGGGTGSRSRAPRAFAAEEFIQPSHASLNIALDITDGHHVVAREPVELGDIPEVTGP